MLTFENIVMEFMTTNGKAIPLDSLPDNQRDYIVYAYFLGKDDLIRDYFGSEVCSDLESAKRYFELFYRGIRAEAVNNRVRFYDSASYYREMLFAAVGNTVADAAEEVIINYP